MVILALSIVGGNLPNSYSLALSFQNVHSWFIKVPRFLWTTVGTIIYIGIGIAAAYDFAESLTTFMSILSYYLAMYTTIVLEEHLIFRKGNWFNYNLEAWNDKLKLPPGYAAIIAFCFGMMGVVLGMAQTWYIGVIGGEIGDPAYGGDIAFELAATFAGIIYPLARIVEKKYYGR
jgi:purine-cytosine permease-like protein